ncbi:MAG TPA: type II toxin-antitoxin system PemK/MazF family toxin [Candidatus Nanoarchaeia archaeon]|nr:type II toxin-antitoxin system PemK/MazF family toxin [Candidatus Nanoarchaeia archaeon]
MFEQKEIVLLPFPYSDLTGAKLRPALILSNNKINSTCDRICCLVTSNKLVDHSILLKSESFATGKLPFKSWVKPHRLFTIHEKIIKKKLCSVTDDFHSLVLQSINDFLE